MEAAKFCCEECRLNIDELHHFGVQLNVHHVFYLPGKKPWEYPPALLMSLCERCHKERQDVELDVLVNVATIIRDKSIPELKEQPIYAFFRRE